MISSQHEAFGRLTTRLKNKCKSENIFGGASVRVFMCATIYRSWNIFASDDGQNVALFLCFTITSYNHDRRLQMWSWKPTWQRLRHPSPPRPPPPPPSQTKVSRVMMRMMVFFVFASLVRIFGWVHWLYIDGDKCSSYAKACQCDYTLRPCGLEVSPIPREVKNFFKTSHFVNKKTKKMISSLTFCQKRRYFVNKTCSLLLHNSVDQCRPPTNRPVTGFLLVVKGDSSRISEERWGKIEIFSAPSFSGLWFCENFTATCVLIFSLKSPT